MSGKVAEVGDQNFEAEVLKSPVPVLVDLGSVVCTLPDARSGGGSDRGTIRRPGKDSEIERG
jgi:hypothetical protein